MVLNSFQVGEMVSKAGYNLKQLSYPAFRNLLFETAKTVPLCSPSSHSLASSLLPLLYYPLTVIFIIERDKSEQSFELFHRGLLHVGQLPLARHHRVLPQGARPRGRACTPFFSPFCALS